METVAGSLHRRPEPRMLSSRGTPWLRMRPTRLDPPGLPSRSASSASREITTARAMSAELPGAPRPGGTGVTDRLERWLQSAAPDFASWSTRRSSPARRRRACAAPRSRPARRPSSSWRRTGPSTWCCPARAAVDNARLRAVLGTRTLRFATHAGAARADRLRARRGAAVRQPVRLARARGRGARGARRRSPSAPGSNTVSIIMRGDDFLRLSDAACTRSRRPPAPGV